jgi:hypothetical protein
MVTEIHAAKDGLERISIKWDDGFEIPWLLLGNLRYFPGRVVELCYRVKRESGTLLRTESGPHLG